MRVDRERPSGHAPPGRFVIADLTPAHAAQAARLHIAGQPGTFLTSLGPGVLTAIYAALPTTRAGFGFAALDEQGQALGFVAATVGVGKLFVEIGLTRMGSLAPPLLAQMARRPGLILHTGQTVLYPLLVRAEAGPTPAELLAIMVEPAWRSHGMGAALVERLVEACRARDIACLDVTVDAANEGAQRFYQRHGFMPHRTFTLYGRAMQHLRRTFSA